MGVYGNRNTRNVGTTSCVSGVTVKLAVTAIEILDLVAGEILKVIILEANTGGDEWWNTGGDNWWNTGGDHW